MGEDASRQKTLQNDIERLSRQRANAEKSLAMISGDHDIAGKIIREETDEQEQSRRNVDRTLKTTTAMLDNVRGRVATLEDTMLDRVRDAVARDPLSREHDVFLSYAEPDKEMVTELYAEMVGRGLDVWFDGAELHLGASLTRQIDRGIARSRVGVILITKALLQGRHWTEREMGGLISSRRRVIPVLDGVSFEQLSAYSPLLADLVGLNTDINGLDEIAEQITTALDSGAASNGTAETDP
jgi:TIR domain